MIDYNKSSTSQIKFMIGSTVGTPLIIRRKCDIIASYGYDAVNLHWEPKSIYFGYG